MCPIKRVIRLVLGVVILPFAVIVIYPICRFFEYLDCDTSAKGIAWSMVKDVIGLITKNSCE